jgi:NitT/TauT family transport system substrate-binding protein
MLKKIFALGAVLGLVTALEGTARAESVSLTLPVLSLTFSADYIADSKGFWKDQGLDVEMQAIPGIGGANAVLAGSVDFGQTSGGAFLNANARGQKLYAIANTIEKMPLEIVISKAFAQKAGITEKSSLHARALALKGARMGIDAPNSIVHGFLKYVMLKNGLNPETDAVISPMQPLAVLAAFKAGQIDGFAFSSPWPAVARKEYGAVTVSSALGNEYPELQPFAYNLLFTRPEYCVAHADTCRKMARGVERATQFMHDHPDEALTILQQKLAQTEPALVAEGFKSTLAATPRVPRVDVLSLQHAQDYMLFTSLIEANQKLPNFNGLYTNDYLK